MQSIPPHRHRKLKTWSLGKKPAELIEEKVDGQSRTLLDLASNDYLGLSRHPKLIDAAQTIMKSDGVGAGASRLITGSRPIHKELEKVLARWLKVDSVLLFPSGFQANLAAVIALADRHTTVIADKLTHHSLLTGIKASGARLKRFAHNDLHQLEKCLKFEKEKTKAKLLVVTESLFSMEGTSAPINGIAALTAKYGAQLLVDEAHALGIMGQEGRGLCYGLEKQVTIVSGTFGKAFGSGGAFLASTQVIREQLLQASGAFKYTTALAPPLCAAAMAALELIKTHPSWGIELQKRSIRWRDRIESEGWSRPLGEGHILSLIIGEDLEALHQQAQLEKQGILSVAIRPPTVPEGTSRLRLVLHRDLPKGTLEKLLKGLRSK